MKILFLDHPQHTAGTWTLFEGLIRILGADAIVVFPYKAIYVGQDMDVNHYPWYRDVYKDIADGKPLPAGIPPLAPGESLTTNDVRTMPYVHSCSWAYSDQYPLRNWTEEEVVAAIDADVFDLVVLGNSHRVPTIALARLRDRCKRLPPIVYYDAGERDELNAHWWHVFHPAVTFKQILTPAVLAQYPSPQVPARLFPMPLANSWARHKTLRSVLGAAYDRRPVDVWCHLGDTWSERVAVTQRVASTVERNRLLGMLRAAPAGIAYLGLLCWTRIAVSMRGSGRDTDRYWEIPACGAALVADGTMGCIHPFPFQDGVNAAFYRNLDQLERVIVELHHDEGKRHTIATAGRLHLERFHTVEARGLFFLSVIAKELGIGCRDAAQEASVQRWLNALYWPSLQAEWRGEVVGYEGGGYPVVD